MTPQLIDLPFTYKSDRAAVSAQAPGSSRPNPVVFRRRAAPASINFAPWQGGTVLATMHAKAQKRVSDAQQAAQASDPNIEIDDSTLADAPQQELHDFAKRVSEDLYPFVRSELYALSSRAQAVRRVMLQPYPKLQDTVGFPVPPA